MNKTINIKISKTVNNNGRVVASVKKTQVTVAKNNSWTYATGVSRSCCKSQVVSKNHCHARMSDDQKIEIAAQHILNKYKLAFDELAR